MSGHAKRAGTISTVLVIAVAVACGDGPDADAAAACTDCVVLDTVATLDFSDQDFFPSPFGGLAAAVDRSTWAFVDRQVATKVTVFESDTVAIVGGEGDGPGEYRQIDEVWFRPGGGLTVLDRSGTRLRRYDGDLQLESEQLVDFRIRAPSVVGDDHLLVVADRDSDGVQLGHIGPDGEFSPLDVAPDSADPLLMLTASDSDGTGWFIEPHSFRIWTIPPDDTPRVLTDEVPAWFAETYPPDVAARMDEIGADTEGATALGFAYDVQNELLWVTVGVPSEAFTVAMFERMMAGEMELRSEAMDHVIVAVSPEDGSIRGIGRFDYLDLVPGAAFLYELADPESMRVKFPRLAGAS